MKIFGKQNNNKSGFSLVEMSVVLASVAAVIVVTAGGVSLINKAKIGQIIDEVSKFTAATAQFEQQYGALPGDMADVSRLSGATAGNGDGTIDTDQEALNFWQHLSLSGLIEGSYDGSSTNIPGTGVPAGPVSAVSYTHLTLPTSPKG